MTVQYTPRNMHTVFALLCFVVVIHWLIFQYPSGLLHWHCGNLTIAPVPAKQPWWIWINTSCEFIMNDCITTTKQNTTKPCAYFLGYTVHVANENHIVANICGSLSMQFLTISCAKCEGWGHIQVHYTITKQAHPVFFWSVYVMPTGIMTELICTWEAATAAFEEFAWWQGASHQWYLNQNNNNFHSRKPTGKCHIKAVYICNSVSVLRYLPTIPLEMFQKSEFRSKSSNFPILQYFDYNQ